MHTTCVICIVRCSYCPAMVEVLNEQQAKLQSSREGAASAQETEKEAEKQTETQTQTQTETVMLPETEPHNDTGVRAPEASGGRQPALTFNDFFKKKAKA